jgi:cytochrome d ubiquinol oxidase subunit I
MDLALSVHRLHFAFTATYHYLFPQLTMGLALLLVILKSVALLRRSEHYNEAVRFWSRIFAINFGVGVVTGIPMEFQFGTNWAAFSQAAGGVIGQTLAMEGVFAFFLESMFLGLLLFGEKKLGQVGHWFAALMVFLGSWLSGYFIIATDAWMQHPVGHEITAGGAIVLRSLGALLTNPWALWQYAHNMNGAVITGSVVMAGIGAFYLILRRHEEHARTFVRTGVIAGFIASILQVFPTGDMQGRLVADHQPATLAAMEGLFSTEHGAPLAIIGQPDMERQRLDNPIIVPKMLSFLTYRHWGATVRGLEAFPKERWPDNIPLLYFSYRIMVGLGTMFIAALGFALLLLARGRLYGTRWMLWVLMLALPFPYIANTAGWVTAEVGRQPWLIYGLMRTADGYSTNVSAGNGLFTLLGFLGLYLVLGILFLFLVRREIEHGPGNGARHHGAGRVPAAAGGTR